MPCSSGQGGNLADALSRQAQSRPHAIAIHLPDRTISFEQLDEFTWRAASLLQRGGVRPGDVVGLTFASELLLIIAMLATARIGATVFSIPMQTPEPLHREMCKKANIRLVASDLSKGNPSDLPEIRVDFPRLGETDFPSQFTVRESNPSAPWLLISGTGSTGESKLIAVSHQQAIARNSLLKHWLPMTQHDRVTTLSHLDFTAPKHRYLEILHAGASMVLFNRDTEDPIELCKRFQLDILHATVVHVEQMLKSVPPELQNQLPQLKALTIGASTVSDDLRKRIAKSLTQNLYVRYATNETGPLSVASPPEVFSIPGSIGRPLPEVTVEIVDRTNQKLAPCNIGLIRVRSPAIVDQYVDNPSATKRAFISSWFFPGDTVKMNDSGHLVYYGRADHMMIMNGINIYPAEIERVITTHPSVCDAATMPIDSPVHQHIPVCAVVLKDELTATERDLLDFSFQHLGERSPKRIVMLKKIPRNTQGKLIRAELAADIARHLGLRLEP